MQKEELLKLIIKAFPLQPLPAPERLVLGSSGEAISVKGMLVGKRWDALQSPTLSLENAALGYLSDDAFRYYLPAYLMLILNELSSADIIASSLLRHLSLPLEVDTLRLMQFLESTENPNGAMDSFLKDELKSCSVAAGDFIRKMQGFTKVQNKTISQFLDYISANHSDFFDEQEAEIANMRYWRWVAS